MASRPFDLAFATLALIVAAPFLALAAVGIRLSSPGPVLYRARRIGRGGEPFIMYKLRTMHVAPAQVSRITGRDDPRVFPLGRWLRRTKVDELPQLVNVLRGEMAIIGPRPTIPVQVEQYTPRQRGRLAVKPGITGWAQVNGRASLPWSERIELDLWYIEHRSWRLDLTILARTAAMVLHGAGLYKGASGGWDAS